MGLLDETAEEPNSRLRRYIIGGLVFVLLLALGIWWMFRFHAEKRTVEKFMDAVVAGEYERAYQLWQPTPAYTFQDFLDDWGEQGYYGPVRSYRISTAQRFDGASGVIVVVSISPYSPYPDHTEKAKHERSQEVHLWVERRDHSISFAPQLPRGRAR